MALLPPQISFLRYAIGDVYIGEDQLVKHGHGQGEYPLPIAVRRADISRSHGVTPNVISLDIVPLLPNDLFDGSRQGDLYVTYEGATLRMRDCLIDTSSIALDPDGRVYQLNILDRRWKWAYGAAHGHYNRRTETGKLINTELEEEGESSVIFRKMTALQLAKELLSLMGEWDNFEIHGLPDKEAGPESRWNYDNPARCLVDLCDMYGCRVVYGFDEKVYIFPLGQAWGDLDDGPRKWANREERAAERRAQRLARLAGAAINNPPLPMPLPVIRYSESVDAVERPNRITIVTAPIVRQYDFELEAVGEDIDGLVKRLKELSYAPDANDLDGGFAGPDGNFGPTHGVNLVDADKQVQNLAKKTCFKWYRVVAPFTFADKTVGESYERDKYSWDWLEDEIERLAEIKPIIQYQAYTSVEEGLLVDNEAIVYGQFYVDGDNNVTQIVPLPKDVTGYADTGILAEKLIVPITPPIDTRKAILKFRAPICRLITGVEGEDDYFRPAKLRLRCCFQRRSPRNGAWQSYQLTRAQPTPWLGTDNLYVMRDDITPVIVATFPGKRFDQPVFEDNLEEVDSLCEEYIDAIEKTFEPLHPTEVVLAGFYPQIDLDGVIRGVSFRIDVEDTSAPITTTVEIDQDVPGMGQLAYAEIRQRERVLNLRQQAQILRPFALRRNVRQEVVG